MHLFLAMADATSLFALRDKWQLPENPLDKSFRCNDQIAIAVKTWDRIQGSQVAVIRWVNTGVPLFFEKRTSTLATVPVLSAICWRRQGLPS